MTDSGLGSETPSGTDKRTRSTPRKSGDEAYSQARKLEEKVARRDSRISLLRNQLDQVKKREIMLVKEVQRTRELAADSASATSNQFEKMKASLSATHDRERVLRDQLEVARSMASLSCASSIAPSPDPHKQSPMVSFRDREIDHDKIRNLESQLANQKQKTKEVEVKLQQRTAPITPPVTAANPPIAGVVSKSEFFNNLNKHSCPSQNGVDYLKSVTEGDSDEAPLEYETILTDVANNWDLLHPKTTESDSKNVILESLAEQGVSQELINSAANCGTVSEVLQLLMNNSRQSQQQLDTSSIIRNFTSNGVPQEHINSLSNLSGNEFLATLAGLLSSTTVSNSQATPQSKAAIIETARCSGVSESLLRAIEQGSQNDEFDVNQVLLNLSTDHPPAVDACIASLTESKVSELVINAVQSKDTNVIDIHQTLIKISTVTNELQSGTTEYVNKDILIQKAREQGLSDDCIAGMEEATGDVISAVDLVAKMSKRCSKSELQNNLQGKVSDGVLAEIDQLQDTLSYEDVIIKLGTLVDTSWPVPEHNNVQDNPPEASKTSLEHDTRNLVDGNWVRAYDPSSSMFYFMCADGSQENTWYCPPEFDITRAIPQEELTGQDGDVEFVGISDGNDQVDNGNQLEHRTDEDDPEIQQEPHQTEYEQGHQEPLPADDATFESTAPQQTMENDVSDDKTIESTAPEQTMENDVSDDKTIESTAPQQTMENDVSDDKTIESTAPQQTTEDEGNNYDAVTNSIIPDENTQPPPVFDTPGDSAVDNSVCSGSQDEVTWPVGTKARLEAVQVCLIIH